jgi:valyl-tRNA synthetase
MSKSKGNVIDPLEVMESHGTDAFRFTLAAFAAQGRDIKLSEERVIGYRNFCNKIWNACRFLFSTAQENVDWEKFAAALQSPEKIQATHPFSQWMLWMLSDCVGKVREALDEFRFNDAAMATYHFFWGIFCDWYLEFIKETLKSENKGLRAEFATTAYYVLDQSLRALHPFMPFLSEELWQAMVDRKGNFVAVAAFPVPLPENILKEYQSSKEDIEAVRALFEKVRQIRMETGMALSKPLGKVSIYSDESALLGRVAQIAGKALNLIGGMEQEINLNDPALKKERGVARGVTSFRDLVVLVDLKGLVDLGKERSRQEKEKAKLEKGLAGHQSTLNNPKFRESAPEELVKEKEEKIREYQQRIQEIDEALKYL